MKYEGSCHCGHVKFEAEGDQYARARGVNLAKLPVKHFDGRSL